MQEKLILTIAPTGNVPTKEMNPNVPMTPVDIAAQIYECWKAGAAVCHIHTRDNEGKPTSDAEVNRAVLAELDKYTDCDIIRQLSTGGRAGKTYHERGQMLFLSPDMASLATGSSNFPTRANLNDPETVSFLAGEMKKYGIKPEVEVFDSAMIDTAIRLCENTEIDAPMHFNFVLGMKGSLPAKEKTLFYLYESLPPNSTWGVSVIGKDHVKLSVIAMALGGHVRVGLEDNIYHSKGVLATNVGLVQRMVNIAKAIEREIATPAEARAILSLKKK
jgi:3-keto-5-aminohexanoate cleavage enzyme